MKILNAPKLEGFITLAEAAEHIGVSRQHSWRMAAGGKWKTLHRIGNSDVYVVSVEEVAQKHYRRHGTRSSYAIGAEQSSPS